MEKENIDSNILDEGFLENPENKYLVGNYTLDEMLKIFSVLFANILIIIGSQLIFEKQFLARLFLPIAGILLFTFIDLIEKREQLRWKAWVLFFTILYYLAFEFSFEIL